MPDNNIRPWRATVITLYPEMFPANLGLSMAGRALEKGTWAIDTVNPRSFGLGKHRSVDDTPCGGGAGMVLRPDVMAAALDAAAAPTDCRPRIFLTPRGKPLTQARVRKLAEGEGVIVVCGHFEGLDERVITRRNLEEISIGDFILSGGEMAATLLLDACIRILPDVMGHAESGIEESFERPLLEYPHYTRPQEWEGEIVPQVLLSGDHKAIAKWRKTAALEATRQRRPDLWAKYVTTCVLPIDKPSKIE